MAGWASEKAQEVARGVKDKIGSGGCCKQGLQLGCNARAMRWREGRRGGGWVSGCGGQPSALRQSPCCKHEHRPPCHVSMSPFHPLASDILTPAEWGGKKVEEAEMVMPGGAGGQVWVA